MPLFRLKGQPEDNTYLYESNPDPERYEEVTESVSVTVTPEPAAAEVAAPEPVTTPTTEETQ
jgi:hypothetical protein